MNKIISINTFSESAYEDISRVLRSNGIGYHVHIEYTNEEERKIQAKKATSKYFTLKKYWAKHRRNKLNNGDAG